MNKYKTLLSNTLLISIGTFGSKILVFFMVRFYTGYLSPADYGTADLITQTANLLFPIISLGITEGVFRFAIDKDINRNSVFSSGLYVITFGGLLFFLITPILTLVDGFDGFIWLIIVYTMSSCYHALCSQYVRAIGKTALFAIQGIINTAFVIALNILFLAVLRIGVVGYVLSVVLADFLCTVFLFIKEKLWRVITLKPDKDSFKKMMRYSIPLIPATVSWWITSVSNRYMVNGFMGSEANGILAVSYKIPTILTLVATIFMQAWQFSAVVESQGDKAEHAKFFSKVWAAFQAIMFLAGSVVIAFASPAIKILATEEFYSAWKYVPVLSISMVFTAFSSFTGSVYIVTKQSGISFLTAITAAVSNVILNLILIPSPLGIQGAAIATMLSYFIVFVIRAVNVRRYIPFKIYGLAITVNTLIVTVQTVFAVCELKGNIIVQAVGILLLCVFNFKFLKIFLDKILSFVKSKKAC